MKFQKELDIFAGKAKEFSEWCESDLRGSFEDLIKAEKFLAELHLSILNLPEPSVIWEDLEDFKEDKELKFERRKNVRDGFKKLPIDGYWEIFDASNLEEQNSVFAEVSDDLADIYSHIKTGLILYNQERLAEAFWEWKFNFNVHWGNHLVGATKAIRNYRSFKTEI